MNREIKFRAWDGKQMYHDFLVARPQMCNVLGVLFDEDFAKNTYDVAEWKLMQYTGLKDKNGKNIYEGDIVKTDYYNGIPGERKRLVGVITYDYTYSFRVYGINKYEGLRKELHPLTEVVGNIYESPELIQSKTAAQ